jgi:ketosteroid isomerase-like protein
MYHAVVEAKLRAAFRTINEGNYAPIVAQFADEHRHVMHGTHALSGARTTRASTQAWYERLARLLPDLNFTVHAITVAGPPWNTRATVEWSDAFTLPDGSRGSNQGVHAFRLKWGRVTSLEVHCDTARLDGICARLAALGVEEALSPPIVDPLLAQ